MYKLDRESNKTTGKKDGNYIVKFWVGKRRIRKSTRTKNKELANEYAKKLYEDTYKEYHLSSKAHYTWAHGVVLYLREKQHVKSLEDIKRHLKVLGQLLKDVRLIDIDRELIEYIKHERKQQYVQRRKKVNGEWVLFDTDKIISNASVNRMLEVLRAVLRTCVEHEILETVPTVKLLHEEKERIRWLTKEEAKILLAELPPHLSQMARFTLLTGLREKNICTLQWSQVDLERSTLMISAENLKNSNSLSVPLSHQCVSLLQQRIGEHPIFVFTYMGKPIQKANTKAWRNSLKRCSIDNFRWHDLRHTWASWHVQNGTPLEVLMKLGGWSSLEMVMKYAHLGQSHVAEHADNVSLDL